MSLFGNLLIVLGQLTRLAVEILELLIILRVLMSWVRVNPPLNRLTRLFYAVTEAIYRPVRAVMPVLLGGMDFTPLFALAGLYAIDRLLVSSIIRLGYQLSG